MIHLVPHCVECSPGKGPTLGGMCSAGVTVNCEFIFGNFMEHLIFYLLLVWTSVVVIYIYIYIYRVQPGYVVVVWVLVLKNTWIGYDLRQYPPYTSINTKFIPAIHQAKISLATNTSTRLVWKFFKNTQHQYMPGIGKRTPPQIPGQVWYVQKEIPVQHWF